MPERVTITPVSEKGFRVLEKKSISLELTQCYGIAWNLMRKRIAERYVLGIVSQPSKGLCVGHAWARLPDGSHVDPLFQWHGKLTGAEHVAYYQLTLEELLDRLRAQHGEALFANFMDGTGPGLDPPRINLRGEIFFGDD